MEPVIEKSPNQNSGSGIVLGCVTAVYILACLCIGGYAYFFRQQIPGVQNYFPTETATPTATPIPHQPTHGDKVIKDDFSDNKKDWQSESNNSTTYVKDGILVLWSARGDSYGLTKCGTCPKLADNLYIEADFSTNQAIDEYYGLAFNIGGNYDAFYSFQINATQERYVLYKRKSGYDHPWMLRISKETSLIKPYPQANKLAISFDKDLIKLYINGSEVDSYKDPETEFRSGAFGFYVDSIGFHLIVDNLYAYGK